MSHVEADDFAAVRRQFSRGVVRVCFNGLNFDHVIGRAKHRATSKKIVARLRDVFTREGCRRSDERNFIDAVVDDYDLQQAMLAKGLTNLDCADGDLPVLFDDLRVNCLHGLHRILAAKYVLNGNEQWWTVRLFSKDFPESACTRIIEEYSNEQSFSDGEIFHWICFYRREKDCHAEQKWWARLSHTKQKDLKQLLSNKTFAEAFYRLLPMPGLWYPVQLGTLHRFLGLKCDEELLHGLQHVSNVWDPLLSLSTGQIPGSAVDAITVQKLELLAPSQCDQDKEVINQLFSSRLVFPSVTDQGQRDALKSNILAVPCLIPSLRSFFENLKYLEPCSLILKQLLGSNIKRTIRQSFGAVYYRPANLCIQYSDQRIETRPQQSLEIDQWVGYIQLWAYCIRHFPQMTSFSPRKESGKEKPAPIESNPALWHGLATLAISAGFRTAKALELQEQDPDQDLAIQFLRKARPYNDEIGDYVRAIVSVLKQIRKSTSAAAPPDAADNTYLSLDRRCGRPFEDDYLRDRRNVFLPNIYNRAPSGCLTSLQVKCQLFYEFFGDLQQSEDFFPSQAEASANGDTDMIDAPPDLRATSCEESDCVHAAQRMELERTLYDVRQRIRDVETGSEASKAALFTLTNDKAFVEEEKRALQDERGELQKQIRELRESQQNSEQRTQRQERERELEQEQQVWLQEQLRDVKQQAQEQLVQLEERLQEVNQQAQDHLRTAEILQKELQNAQQQVEQIKTAKEDLEQDSRRAAESASDHRRSLEKELNDIRQEAEQSKLAKDDLERKYLVAESGVRQWELREQQLEEGLRKVQQNMQELAQSLSQANEAEEKTKLDLHSAQKDILAKDGRLVELKDEVQKLQKRLEEAQISTLRPCISFTEVKSAKDVFDRLDELMIERVKEEIQFKKPQEAVIVYAVKYYHGGLSCVQVTLQEEQRDLESLQGLIAFYEREHRTLMLAMSSQMDWLPRNSPQAFYDACKRSGYCVFGTQEDVESLKDCMSALTAGGSSLSTFLNRPRGRKRAGWLHDAVARPSVQVRKAQFEDPTPKKSRVRVREEETGSSVLLDSAMDTEGELGFSGSLDSAMDIEEEN